MSVRVPSIASHFATLLIATDPSWQMDVPWLSNELDDTGMCLFVTVVCLQLEEIW